MSLLEIITKAAADPNQPTPESTYPITLNPDAIFLTLKPTKESPDDPSLIHPVTGWQILERDSQILRLGQNFCKTLSSKLQNPKSFKKEDFIGTLITYLEKCKDKVGISAGVLQPDEGYSDLLVEKLGFLIDKAVLGLVLEACVVLETWELLETLIVHGFVANSCSSNLINGLIEKKRSDLVCLCVKHVKDIQASDLVSVLKYFLSPPIDSYVRMVRVREEWESQALEAIKLASDQSLGAFLMAKEASVLLMMAHDGFSANELCLHYLLASSNLDEVILASCIAKLNGTEIMGFVRYLGKWLKKYEKFPQACPCPKASSMLGLKACDWVPTLEDVVKCYGLVLDEHFSSLVLHPEFHEELLFIRGVADSLASTARLCCTVANLAESMKAEIKGA
ncbi:hypothetical protein RJ640_005386 [Escallonia rubra]|uniref:Uncharacterized protein n=1 Tax=Escallonia rubra TaxID=112253 RepID=A0AA88S8N0_9ASTE|nr:hypothetical protein RJ640_005386 [Escallonia rubra]